MSELPKDIAKIDERIKKMRHQGSSPKKRSPARIFWENAFRIATEFVSPVIIGICIGFVADKFFHTRPFIMLIMAIFGGAAGMLNVYRSAQQIDKDLSKE